MNTELEERNPATADSAVTQVPPDQPEVSRERETPETTNTETPSRIVASAFSLTKQVEIDP